MRSARPSPARADAPEPAAWLPIPDLAALESLESRIDPALVRELEGLDLEALERQYAEPPAPDRPAVAPPLPASPTAVPTTAQHAPPPAPRAAGRPAAAPPVAERHHHHWFHLVVLGVALAVVAAGVPYFLAAPAQQRVTVRVDGADFTRTTRLGDVGSFLTAAAVSLGPGDRAVPAVGARLRDGLTIRVLRALALTVDVDGRARAVQTTARSPNTLRRALGLPATMVALDTPSRLRPGATVVFRTPHDLSLTVDGTQGALRSTALTVGELLAERGVTIAPGDEITPDPTVVLTHGLSVTVTHTSADRVAEDVAVPFDTQTRSDPTFPQGEQHVLREGADGIDRVTYQLDRRSSAAKQPLGTVRVRAPQPKIVAVGTLVVEYPNAQRGTATWYATLHQPGTCAHLDLAMGTVVRLVNQDTGATTTCRVADRGPEAWTGYLIDLSPDVFERLAPLSAGTVSVRLEY